jgi:hypothetical protein
VADISEDDIILGYPFFEAVNPQINWPTGLSTDRCPYSTMKNGKNAFPRWEQKDTSWAHNIVQKTIVAQQLAEHATDKKEKTWEEQVPVKYH